MTLQSPINRKDWTQKSVAKPYMSVVNERVETWKRGRDMAGDDSLASWFMFIILPY